MIEQIKELTMRKLKEPPKELLKPTKLNLYGLDIRFRYTEELLRKEKESKRILLAFYMMFRAKANQCKQDQRGRRWLRGGRGDSHQERSAQDIQPPRAAR